MKNSISILLIATLSLLFASCESSLSDEEISNPAVISPQIIVSKDRDYRGLVSYTYECVLADKGGARVALKNGSVSMNSTQMILTKDLIGSYYTLTTKYVPYLLGTKYTFKVLMANGASYDAVITTPVIDLSALAAPEMVAKTSNMFIQWAGIDSNVTMYLSLKIYYRLDGQEKFFTRIVEVPNPMAAMFTLTPDQFLSPTGSTYGVEVGLNAEIEGTIDARFGRSRKAIARQSVSKLVGVQ